LTWLLALPLNLAILFQPDVDSHEYGPDDDFIVKNTLPLLNRTIMYLIKKVEEYNLTDDLNIIITRYNVSLK